MNSTSLLGEVGQDAHEVRAALERGAGGGHDVRAHLVGHDGGQRGLAEAGRAGEQDVIERLAALARGLHRHAQALHRRALADVLVEALRAELPLDLRLLRRRRQRGSITRASSVMRARASPRRPPR